jgi:autotransporter-associated beta strand protein
LILQGILDLNGTAQQINGFSGNGVVTNSSSLDLSGNGVLGSGSAAFAELAVCVRNVAKTFTFDGSIQGPVNLSKMGAQPILVLTHPNTYTGTTTAHAGVLRLGIDNALPVTTILILGSGTNDVTVDLAGFNQQVAGLRRDTSGTCDLTNSGGPVTLTFNKPGGAAIFAGRILDRPLAKLNLTVAGGALALRNVSSSYRGLTLVTNAGSALTFWTRNPAAGPFVVADGTTFGASLSASNDTLNAESLTFGASMADQETLKIDLGSFGKPTNAPITVGQLTINGTLTLNVAWSKPRLGQFPLLKYSGAIGGAGFNGFTLGSLPPGVTAQLVNNASGSSVDLKITDYVGSLAWTGNSTGGPANAWDLGLTKDWADVVTGVPAAYNETKGIGPLVLFDDTASNGVVNVTTSVKPFSVTFNNSTNLNFTVGGAGSIAGQGSLTVSGGGPITLSSANSYNGDTIVSNGTLKLGANGVIPSVSGGSGGQGNVTVNDTLDIAGTTQTINGLNGVGLIDNTMGTGTIVVGNNDQSSTFDGLIQNSAGSLSLTKAGGGTLTLTGANTYTGSTTVEGGTLALMTESRTPGPISVAFGSTLSLTTAARGSSFKTASLTLGSLAIPIIDFTTLNFNLGFFGNPTQPPISASNLTVYGQAQINITGSGFALGSFPLIAHSGAVSGSGSFVLGTLPPGLGAYLSNSASALELVVTNPAYVVWTGLQNANWDIGLSKNWQFGGTNTTYQDEATVFFGPKGGSKPQVNLTTIVAPGDTTVNTSGNDYSFVGPGSLGGFGRLAKTGSGTLTLSTSNSFTGTTLVQGGTLKLANSAALSGTSLIAVSSNCVLDATALPAPLVIPNNSSLTGDGMVQGPVTVAPGASVSPGSSTGTLTFSDNLNLQGNVTLVITKSGTVYGGNKIAVGKQLTFGGSNTLTVVYSGPALTGGEVFKLFNAGSYNGVVYSTSLPPLPSGLNWALSRLTVDGTIAVNQGAVAGTPLVMTTGTNQPIYLSVTNLLALSSEPENERITLVSIGAPLHGTTALDSDRATLIYYPQPGYLGSDQFTYTISDEHGGLTVVTNEVEVADSAAPAVNRFDIPTLTGRKVHLRFYGLRHHTYTFHRSTDLADWQTLATQAADLNGQVNLDDTNSPPQQAFYRAVHSPTTIEDLADQILRTTDVKGGFIAHVGSGDGQLTAALQQSLSYRVQGLDQSDTNVMAARQYVMSLGLYGYVSVDRWDGAHLPYIDNFVNLAVVQDTGTMTTNEIMRVLAPQGVAYIQQGVTWSKIVKPRPADIDDWTHYAHDAAGTCVAQDTVAGPPKRYQWLAGPRYNRHHDVMSSFNAGVSANGRLIYVEDEGSRESILLPPSWALFARDAFNGTLLWRRSISSWHPSMYGLKSGPAQLPRRLVGAGDMVFATLDYYGPVVALDAATGATLQTFSQTAAAEEIYYSDGTLFVLVDPNPRQWAIWETFYKNSLNYPDSFWDDHPRVITALNPTNGLTLWTNTTYVYPTSIAVDASGLVYHDGTNMVKLDRTDGHRLWQSSTNIPVLHPTYTANGLSVIIYKDTVLMAGGPGRTNTAQNQNQTGFIWSVDSTTGQVLAHWPHGKNSHEHSPNDLFALDDLVWSTSAGANTVICTGYDRRTGATNRVIDPGITIDWIHERCYRSKATVNYFFTSRACLESISTKTNYGVTNGWVRAACLYGFIPANGMLYTTPNDCSCQFLAKLTGLGALAPASTDTSYPPTILESARLEKGPAYGDAVPSSPAPDDWPIYRHDAARSGFTTNIVPATVSSAWQTPIGGKLSSVTVAEGSVFVASIDAHTVYALDADSGVIRWSFTAGGRVDSPPTIFQGRILFGSADGSVYCLRASDGALIWRYLAAFSDRRHMSYDQIESVWPVSGSVLMANDTAYFVSGRSMYLDGGLRFVGLNPTNGLTLVQTNMDDLVPGTTDSLETLEREFNAPVALADLLSSDGRRLYMKSQQIAFDGTRTDIAPVSANPRDNANWANQVGDGVHLFTPTGFLDDNVMHRSYWVWGKSWSSGAGGYYIAGLNAPCGQLLCVDQSNVYGYGRMLQYYRWTLPKANMLFSTSTQNNFNTANPYNWTNTQPLVVKGLVAANNTLFLCGPPALEDEEQSFASLDDPRTQSDLSSQQIALSGGRGGLLRAVDKATGNVLATYGVDFIPVWDGMAASRNSLYIATRDGRVICWR